LGVLDNDGHPIKPLGYFHQESRVVLVDEVSVPGYKVCSECSKYTVIRKDGCDFCTSCGQQGSCG
ncbi:hypothetical protein ABS198_21040, partial [Acinetobacter baumannii]